ncbi:major strawberry allergen Fra a 1.04 [Eucalyptus grandis]|uniref:major strawberry allergen Fra a 1.04 n=1 Tax=Eucalyptus grandis TaxID=71139 RepID=UPI00192EBF71|nr:major strawberry allergen Fra a 1.04 [Eucalyptus grandis]
MGVTTFTQEFTTPITPSRMLFRALIVDSHYLIPKIAPLGIKSIEFVEGDGRDGRAGSIKVTNFAEGDVIFDKIESIVYEVQFLASSVGRCLCKMIGGYHTRGDVELNEDDIKQGKEKAMGLYKVVEEYVLGNPNVYV